MTDIEIKPCCGLPWKTFITVCTQYDFEVFSINIQCPKCHSYLSFESPDTLYNAPDRGLVIDYSSEFEDVFSKKDVVYEMKKRDKAND